ncbi:MAG TPA: hypothetical protein VFZ61_33695 [Polyangiales bacterium]
MSRANRKRSAARRAGMLRKVTAARALEWARREMEPVRPLKFSELGLTREQVRELEMTLFPAGDGVSGL